MQAIQNFKVLVISLARDKARRDHMSTQMRTFGLSFEFLDAIDGKNLSCHPQEYDERKRMRLYGYGLSPGELGCFLSHREAWKRCVEENRLCVVFEDDTLIGPTFFEALSIVSKISDCFDLVRLSGLTLRPNALIKVALIGQFLVAEDLKDPGGSGAYVLSPEGAKKLVEKSRRFYCPVDTFLGNRQVNELLSFSLLPYPVEQNIFATGSVERFNVPHTFGYRIRRQLFRTSEDISNMFWSLGRRLSPTTLRHTRVIREKLPDRKR